MERDTAPKVLDSLSMTHNIRIPEKKPVSARPAWGARSVRNNTELHYIKKKSRTNYMKKKYCKRIGETLHSTSSHPRG